MQNNSEDNKIKESISSTFDEVAKNYDKNEHFLISAKKLVQILKKHDMKNNASILDLSTGTANIAIEIAKQYTKSFIHGIDISQNMLKIANIKIKEQNIKNIHLYHQDVENLELSAGPFDLVTCAYGLFFYPNMEKVFCDISTRINKGGRFIFSSFTEDAFQPYTKTFLEMLENNYNIKMPEKLDAISLNSKEDIRKLSSLINPSKLEIEYVKIRLNLSIEQWWDLINSSGFKVFLSNLSKKEYRNFKIEYFSHLERVTSNKIIKLNADTLFAIITI